MKSRWAMSRTVCMCRVGIRRRRIDRNRSRTAILRRPIRIVDEFTNGQISDGHTFYTPRLVDADHIVVQLPQGTVTLQRSK